MGVSHVVQLLFVFVGRGRSETLLSGGFVCEGGGCRGGWTYGDSGQVVVVLDNPVSSAVLCNTSTSLF